MNCKNCNADLVGPYCYVCGQKNYTSKDKNIRSILEEAFHFVTHFEGSFITTLKTIIVSPGKLSLDYCNGIRKKYYKPISFFMLLIVIYLLFPIMQGMNMRMEYYKDLNLSGGIITRQIQEKAEDLHISEAMLSELFHHKSEKTSKILLFALIPLTVGGLCLIPPYKNRRPVYDYYILATEINTMILLNVFLIFPLFYYLLILIFNLSDNEDSIKPVVAVILLSYITIIFRRFFEISWNAAFRRTLFFLLLYFVISQVIYKFILFEVTFLFL